LLLGKASHPKPVDDKGQMIFPSRQITLLRCSRNESRDGSHNMRWLSDGTGQALFPGSYELLQLRQGAGEPTLRRKHAARTKVVLQARP
jgi:hypothetical protein